MEKYGIQIHKKTVYIRKRADYSQYHLLDLEIPSKSDK